MKSELIVDVQPQEIAIALTEDDRLQVTDCKRCPARNGIKTISRWETSITVA